MKKSVCLAIMSLILVSCVTDRSLSDGEFQKEFNKLAKNQTAFVKFNNGSETELQDMDYDGKMFYYSDISNNRVRLNPDSLRYIDLIKVNRHKVGMEYALTTFAFCTGLGFIAENVQSQFQDLDIGGVIIGLCCAPGGYIAGYLIGENIHYDLSEE